MIYTKPTNTHTERNEVLKDFFGGSEEEGLSEELITLMGEFERLMVKYRCAIREVTTKLEVLNDEFSSFTERNPIASIQSRVKRPYSIANKLVRLGSPVTVDAIKSHINDVAGVRVICPFIDDIYKISAMLTQQDDIHLVSVKDYIKNPKPNGYRSLHLLVEIPVFFSAGKENIRVEIQIRTVAMDFWASLEHQIRYKNPSVRTQEIADELKDCADTIAKTDVKMQELRERIQKDL